MTQNKQDNEFKWLLPHSLVRLDNLVKHVNFVGAKHIAPVNMPPADFGRLPIADLQRLLHSSPLDGMSRQMVRHISVGGQFAARYGANWPLHTILLRAGTPGSLDLDRPSRACAPSLRHSTAAQERGRLAAILAMPWSACASHRL